MEELIARHRKLALGCRMHGVFMGVTVYADNVVLLGEMPWLKFRK